MRYNYFRFGKTNVRHIATLLLVATSTISQSSASGYQISSKSGHPRRSNDIIYNFKMVATAAQYYFLFRIWWYRSLQKVQIYPRIIFRHILINSCDCLRFGQTNVHHSGILLPLSILTISHNHYIILYQPAKIHPNRTSRGGYMTSYQFSRWRPSAIMNALWGNGRLPTKCYFVVRARSSNI